MSKRRFRCSECGRYVTVSGVTCLDIVRCPMCTEDVIVPEDSQVVKSNVKRPVYRPKTPCEKSSGKRRGRSS